MARFLNKRLLILIAIFIITTIIGIYFILQIKTFGEESAVLPECITDLECKINNSCDCEAVAIYDQSKQVVLCVVNNCSTYEVKAVCENFQCVKKSRVKGYYQIK